MENQPTQTPIPQQTNLNPPPTPQEGRLKFLEKMVTIDLWLNLIVGGVVLFLIAFVIAWRFEVFDFFKTKQTEPNIPAVTKVEDSSLRIKVAEDAPLPEVYISEQSVDIEKAFKAPPNNLKLTVNGQLKKEVFGFLPYWAIPKLDEIDTTLLTSISYFGLEVDENGDIIKEDSSGKEIGPWYTFNSDPKFSEFINKMKKDRIKVYVTLKCFNQDNIVRLTTSPKAIDNFITNALYLVESKGLDGVNLDFEYIGTPGKEVRDGFSILSTKLNKELKRQYPDAKLTIDTFVDAGSNTRIHDVAVLAKNSDALVIMGYDFHTPNSSKPGPVAPFEGYGNSLNGLLSSYLDKAPTDKIILGVPYYGYDWPISGTDKNSAVLGGRADVKIYPYAEIADANKNTQINWDEDAKSPWYSYIDSALVKHIVYFENPRSLGIKYDFINDKKLQGVGIWALGFDGKRTDLLQLLADKFAN